MLPETVHSRKNLSACPVFLMAATLLASASLAQTPPWECTPEELGELARKEMEIKGLRPGQGGYLPRPYPRTAAEVEANLAVTLAPHLVRDHPSLRSMKQAINTGNARVANVWEIESWGSPCTGKLDGRFTLVADIRDRRGGPPFLAFFTPEGYWGGHSFPDGPVRPEDVARLLSDLPDEGRIRKELASRWKVNPQKIRYFASAVRPFFSACGRAKPCVAFEDGGQRFVFLPASSAPPSGALFRAGETIELPSPPDPGYFEGPPAVKVRGLRQWVLLEEVRPVEH